MAVYIGFFNHRTILLFNQWPKNLSSEDLLIKNRSPHKSHETRGLEGRFKVREQRVDAEKVEEREEDTDREQQKRLRMFSNVRDTGRSRTENVLFVHRHPMRAWMHVKRKTLCRGSKSLITRYPSVFAYILLPLSVTDIEGMYVFSTQTPSTE
jgi:hypothetical protein